MLNMVDGLPTVGVTSTGEESGSVFRGGVVLDALLRDGNWVRIAAGGNNCVRSDGDAWTE